METKCLYSSPLSEKLPVLIGLYGGSPFSTQKNSDPSNYKESSNLHFLAHGGRQSLCVFKGPLQERWKCLCLIIKASQSALQKLSVQEVEGPDSCGHRESNWMPLQLAADSRSLLYKNNHISSTGKSSTWIRGVVVYRAAVLLSSHLKISIHAWLFQHL